MELEGPTCLTPGSSTKPQSSREYGTEKKIKIKKTQKKKRRQYGTGTKTEIQINGKKK